ncbi:MAG: NAD(P)/FAD-dependent oxidoreductase [Phormidesmis sp.]
MKYATSVKQQLDQIKHEDAGSPRKKVLVLGAGIAGLAAGYELTMQGHSVEILEASSRLGGRIWTHRFNNGQQGEFGAMRIPASHDYTRHYVEQLGLGLRPFKNASEKAYFDLEGHLFKVEDAHEKVEALFHLSKRDKDEIKAEADLDTIYLRIVKAILNDLEDAEKAQLFGHGPFSERLRRLDSQSLLQTLSRYPDTTDAIRLMGKATGLDDYWQRSTLLFIREEIDDAFSGLEEIEGGMERLPQALADMPLPNGMKLRDRITFSQEVRAIAQTNESVSVIVKNGSKQETLTAPYVLCTIPFSVLRRIDLHGICKSKYIKDAIQGLGYQSATKVLLNCKQRFWESQEGIYGGKTISDSAIKQTFYPSDNAAERKEISEGPGVLLGSYSWGATARRLGALRPKDRGELVSDRIQRFHPDIKQYLDKSQPYASMAWDQHPYAAGAFSSSYPLDLQMFFPGASQPAGRLFFAGEHLSPYPTWIQGGLWSALQAVSQIVRAC